MEIWSKWVIVSPDLTSSASPVRIFFGTVTPKAQVEVLAYIAVDSAANNESLAVVTGVFHVHHFMVILMTFRLGATWKIHTFKPMSLITANHMCCIVMYAVRKAK